MILCDIGNTSAHIWNNGRTNTINIEKFGNFKIKDTLYYINVNDRVRMPEICKNLEKLLNFKSTYKGLGVDRAFACYSINTGIVIDSGSATTIDLMNNGTHLGGVILPGIESYLQAYASISPRLKCHLNTQLDLDTLPQRTIDAISYGVLKSVIDIVNNLSCGRDIYITGSNGAFFQRYLPNSIYNKNLIFDGMLKLLKEEGLC